MSEEINVEKKKKVQKKFPDFCEVVDSMSVKDLEVKLNLYAKENERVIKAKEDDQDLKRAQELVSELVAPYNDAKKALALKMFYIVSLIEEKGGDISGIEEDK
jgi:hypothetical protein